MRPFARFVVAVSLIYLSTSAVALPSQPWEVRRPDVPWKKDGLFGNRGGDSDDGDDSGSRRRQRGSDCENGPTSRDCWAGDFTIETNFHHEWPNTGKIVQVCARVTWNQSPH